MSSADVIHYYETGGPANLFACGLYDDDREGSPYRADVTCPDCLAIVSPPESKTVTHYAKDSMGRAQCGARLYARIDPSRSLVYPVGGPTRPDQSAIAVYTRAQEIRKGQAA